MRRSPLTVIILVCLLAVPVLAACEQEETFIAAGTQNVRWNQEARAFDGIPYVYAPSGCFHLGYDSGEPEEEPVRRVCLTGFWIGQSEVTNDQYRACVEAGACTAPQDASFFNAPSYGDYPVVFVTWEQAQAYAVWRGGALPSEAQWEYAARGTQGWLMPWGDVEADVLPTCEQAHVSGCGGGVQPVGGHADGASWVGAQDMIGNVSEYTASLYSENYFEVADGATNPTGPENGRLRVSRGGAWDTDPAQLRTTYRFRHTPVYFDASTGFRIVLHEAR